MIPSRPAARLCLATLVLGFVAGCAPRPTLYTRNPWPQLEPFDWDRVRSVSFEDDTRRSLRTGEGLALQGEELVIVRGDRIEVLELENVAGITVEHADGVSEFVEILTPDDLERFDRLPPVDHVVLRDGTLLRVNEVEGDETEGTRVTWAPNRLAILVDRGPGTETREVLIEEIQAIELEENASLVDTVRSPVFWIVGVAAAGAIVLIGRAGDPETTATR